MTAPHGFLKQRTVSRIVVGSAFNHVSCRELD
jgi:hypothetical protein